MSFEENFVGSVFSHYYIENIIQVGGGAAVFRGIDLFEPTMSLSQRAIKILFADAEDIELLEKEASASKILSAYPICNDFVVCMYEYGLYRVDDIPLEELMARLSGISGVTFAPDNYLYIAMELMDGDLLSLYVGINEVWLNEHAEIILGLVHSLLMGLNYIHERGFAHLDIKPENILYKLRPGMTKEDFLSNPNLDDIIMKYGDLGFACSDSKRYHYENVTNCIVKGTPCYSAPELWEKTSHVNLSLDLNSAQKADVWSLGIMFWFMIHHNDSSLCLAGDEKIPLINPERYDVIYQQFIDDLPSDSIVAQLFRNMIVKDPSKRKSTRELLDFF